MSVQGIVKKFKAYKMPSIILKNECRTWIVGGQLQRTANTLFDPWDLMGYEPQSNPTEIIGPVGFRKTIRSGVGYLCDEQGVTVSLERTGPKLTPENAAENQEVVFGFFEGVEYRRNAERLPFILISNNGMTVTWGGMIRTKGQILTDGPGKPVYKILQGTPMIEILNITTGQTSMGYLCDETGVTADLKRDFRVTYPEDYTNPVKLAAIKAKNKEIVEGQSVGILIKFCGAIGALATFDKLPEIWNIGQSKRNLYIGLIAGAGVGLLLGVFV